MAERPNPFSISVGILIALQSDPTSPLHQELDLSPELHQKLSWFLQECVTNDGNWASVQATPLAHFIQQLRSLDESLANLLVECVRSAASSVDSLLDLMESLRSAIGEGIVDGTSAHGVFLRKVCLGFDQLSFETTSLLWSDLQGEIEAVVEQNNNPQQDP